MSGLRTLKFGDRTISYDAGLDSLHFAQQEDTSSNEDDVATEADGVNVNDDAGGRKEPVSISQVFFCQNKGFYGYVKRG